MDIQDQYDRIVAGETDDGDIRWSRRRLQLAALDRAASPDAAARLGALRVAAFIGPTHGLPVTAKLVRDSDRTVRVAAFNQAVAAREDGRALLRDALTGPDRELALAAADLLATAADRPSLNPALRLLQHEDAALRAAAARIVGMVGGRSSLARMRFDGEGDEATRQAMALARARIEGDEPRPAAVVWWGDDEPSFPSPPVGDQELEPAHRAPEPVAPPPAAELPEPAEEVVDATFEDVPTPADAAPQLPAPVDEPPTDVAAPAEPAADPQAPWDGRATPLPATLPTEARALCRLLGMVGDSDRATVVQALRSIDDPTALGDLWIAWQPGGDRALGRGVALAAAALERTAFLSKATTMANDAEPLVRAAAVEAIGALGGASALTRIHRKLTDADPGVRAATATSLAAMGRRLGRESMVSSWLQGSASDADEHVQQAVASALESLS